MNERIRELAEQAGIKEHPAKLSVYKEDDGTTSTKWEYPLEKFAELIVKGCCDWIDGSPVTESGQLILTKSFIIANLKGYFGVEE